MCLVVHAETEERVTVGMDKKRRKEIDRWRREERIQREKRHPRET